MDTPGNQLPPKSSMACSQTTTSESQRLKREKLATERAKILLGCYRKGDATDPEIYVRAIACVLLDYDDWVMVEATHPATGVQATEKFKSWPPNSGEMKAFCEDMAKRAAKYAVYDKLPKPDMTPRLPPPPDTRAGRCANLFIPDTAPHYAAMVERAKNEDPKDWLLVRGGIRIPLDWYPARGGHLSATFKRPIMTEEQLRKLYRKQEAAE